MDGILLVHCVCFPDLQLRFDHLIYVYRSIASPALYLTCIIGELLFGVNVAALKIYNYCLAFFVSHMCDEAPGYSGLACAVQAKWL